MYQVSNQYDILITIFFFYQTHDLHKIQEN